MTYGATQDEWTYWDLMEGCTEDLLPVVCRPDQPLHPNSNLKSYGKVPSRYTVQRQVVGFTNWTSHRATSGDVAIWSGERDFGICLQTRRVRALDFDLTDRVFAEHVKDVLDLLGYDFPWRTRANSSKFLTLFYLEGDYGKQVLQTPHGIIEFLANGQQCVVAGTHPSGARYQWDWRVAIPTFGPGEFAQLLRDLVGIVEAARRDGAKREWSEPSVRRVVERQSMGDGVADPVVDYLRLHQLSLREAQDGRIYLRCPWADAHTTESDITGTLWFPAGTNGYENGHFSCLHAHCQSRTDDEFLRAIGYDADGFEVIGSPVGSSSLDVRGAMVSTSGQQVESHLRSDARNQEDGGDSQAYRATHDQTLTALGADQAPVTIAQGEVHPLDKPPFERDSKGKVKPLLHNLVMALERPDLCASVIGRDEFKDVVMWKPWVSGLPFTGGDGIWNAHDVRPFKDADYVTLALELRKRGNDFGPTAIPTEALRQAVGYVADKRGFDSAVNWLLTLPPWDGIPRIETFCSTYLGAEDSAYTRAVSRYWWSAHAGRVINPGVQADMAVVMISSQGTGKTSSIKAIAPSPEQYVELSLLDQDDNLSRLMRGKVIGELAELKGITTKDVESVKACISRTHEIWVPKYLEFSKSFPRRLVLVGTSNMDEFLSDETGNRRWLPMMLGKQRVDAIVRDRTQLWAEARELYIDEGICWMDAERLARQEHADYLVNDPWQSIIEEWLERVGFDGKSPGDRKDLHVDEVLRDAIQLSPSQLHAKSRSRVSDILRRLGYLQHRTRCKGKQTKKWSKITHV